MFPLKVYCKKGEKNEIVTSNQDIRYTLIVAVSIDEVKEFMILNGGVSAKEFGYFLLSLIDANQSIRT